MLEIITVPHPILREKSLPVTQIDKKLLALLGELGETLVKKTNPPGVGISAVQVGKPIRAFYTYLPENFKTGDDFENPQLKLFLNPTLTKVSAEITLGEDPKNPFSEGCLSIPLIYGPVPRHQWVEVSYQSLNQETLEMEAQTERFEDFFARVIQHEYDHLEGVLFTDRNQADKLPLYFEQDEELVKIKNPQEILTW